jgi:hypothetical protein
MRRCRNPNGGEYFEPPEGSDFWVYGSWARPRGGVHQMPDPITMPAMLMAEDEAFVRLKLPKCVPVLSRVEFVQGLKRGKAWRRAQARRERISHHA